VARVDHYPEYPDDPHPMVVLKGVLEDMGIAGRIAGIGNVYVQDPLFKAGIHPLRKISTLDDDEITALWRAIRETLQKSIDLGGSAWEQDLHGEKGRWDASFLLVGYREGQLCPVCGTPVEKIKTGSTSSFICPRCQLLGDEVL
jgi:formamidopyrimidine-DNA glycosylase